MTNFCFLCEKSLYVELCDKNYIEVYYRIKTITSQVTSIFKRNTIKNVQEL